jgi:hypothetical protein
MTSVENVAGENLSALPPFHEARCFCQHMVIVYLEGFSNKRKNMYEWVMEPAFLTQITRSHLRVSRFETTQLLARP